MNMSVSKIIRLLVNQNPHDCKIPSPYYLCLSLERNILWYIIWVNSVSGNSGILKLKTMGRSERRQKRTVKGDF